MAVPYASERLKLRAGLDLQIKQHSLKAVFLISGKIYGRASQGDCIVSELGRQFRESQDSEVTASMDR